MRNKIMMTPICILLLAPGMAQNSGAAEPAGRRFVPPKHYLCYHTKTPLKIDGKIDEKAWGDAPWTDRFVDIEGDLKPKPRFETRVKMLWDDEFFYFAADLAEPHVWGTLTKHDSVIFHDNDFEIFIDPDGDTHAYYEFEMNALNTTWDLFLPVAYKDGGRALNNWEMPGMKTAVDIVGTLNDSSDVDTRWTLEVALPWKVLAEQARRKTPPADGDQWRENFSRVEWRHEIVDGRYRKVKGKREDNWVWSPQWVINMHRPEQWGFVQFSTAKPGTAVFRPDATGPSRDRLYRVYYAQVEYRRAHERWARSLEELGLKGLTVPPSGAPVRLDGTSRLFEVSTVMSTPDGKARTLIVTQDGRLRSEEPKPAR